MTTQDQNQLAQRGISAEKFEKQLAFFQTGFPYLDIISAATPDKGITTLTPAEEEAALNQSREGVKIAKFVPASGAASRMFKDLFNGLDKTADGSALDPDSPAARFCSNIAQFPFYDGALFGCSDHETLANTLTESGLNYGAKPKGQILFHSYEGFSRTAFEEHLVEGALYATTDGKVNIIYSVSPEHLEGFQKLYDSIKEKYESDYNVKYDIRFTLQSPATDTVAVNEDNTPFRKGDGSLLFRPGGHGALIENVNQVDADIVIIKNIDNVIHESKIEQTIRWKKILTGRLIALREKTFDFLKAIDEGNVTDEQLWEMVGFLDKEFCVTMEESTFNGPKENTLAKIRAKLNRPIRVCGMVRNLGEPGGGPFVIRDASGDTSLQILESVQIDPAKKDLFAAGTHFNPVDLVCSLTDYKGEHFNLTDYVDENAGFISSKSYEGRPLKAQELPGLWNGAMSDWNTQFVDVPLITFNPVKTVLDLLRKEHKA